MRQTQKLFAIVLVGILFTYFKSISLADIPPPRTPELIKFENELSKIKKIYVSWPQVDFVGDRIYFRKLPDQEVLEDIDIFSEIRKAFSADDLPIKISNNTQVEFSPPPRHKVDYNFIHFSYGVGFYPSSHHRDQRSLGALQVNIVLRLSKCKNPYMCDILLYQGKPAPFTVPVKADQEIKNEADPAPSKDWVLENIITRRVSTALSFLKARKILESKE